MVGDNLHQIMGTKWITMLQQNNFLVINDVNASFAVEAYISTDVITANVTKCRSNYCDRISLIWTVVILVVVDCDNG